VRPLDGIVLVPTGARLFEGPGQWLEHAKTGYRYDNDWVEKIRPMQVVGEAGEFFAIRTNHEEPRGRYCYAARNLFRGFNLVVYVPKSDVLPVLTKRHVRKWSVGTSLELEPGLGMLALGKGRYRLVARPFVFELDLPADSVGNRYRPKTRRPAPFGPQPHLELRNRSAKLILGDDAQARLAGRRTAIFQVQSHALGALVTMEAQCATLQAIVPASDVVRLPEVTTMSGYGTSCGGVVPGLDFQVGPDVPVFWRDGRPAGRTTHLSSLHAYDRRDVGELACFPKSPGRFGCGSERVRLCLPKDQLTVIPVRRSQAAPEG